LKILPIWIAIQESGQDKRVIIGMRLGLDFTNQGSKEGIIEVINRNSDGPGGFTDQAAAFPERTRETRAMDTPSFSAICF
jgi:hypothetical protein